MARKDPEQNRAYNREYMRQKRAAAKAAGIRLAGEDWAKNNPEKRSAIDKRYAERHPEKVKAKGERQRAARKAAGIKQTRTEEQKARLREYMAHRRAAAKLAGVVLPSEQWRENNWERNRQNEQRWRDNNRERYRAMVREKQAKRRSTPWGTINNRLYPVMIVALRRGFDGTGKYVDALGYNWTTLKRHIETQFSGEMSWDNWGSLWEIDHIKPLKLFKYESLDDPLFRQAWDLGNLRPLLKHENARKGGKH